MAGTTSAADSGNNSLMISAVVLAALFVVGFYVGQKFPPSDHQKQNLLVKRVELERKRVLSCEKDVQNLRYDKTTSVDQAAANKERASFISRDTNELNEQLQMCQDQSELINIEMQQCNLEDSDLNKELKEHSYMVFSQESLNVQGLLDVASKNSSMDELKALAEKLKKGEPVKRVNVINKLLNQVEATRKRLAKLKQSCEVPEDRMINISNSEYLKQKEWFNKKYKSISPSLNLKDEGSFGDFP
jgi:prefoldin subunit 5